MKQKGYVFAVKEKDRVLRSWMIKDIRGEESSPEDIQASLHGDVIPLTRFEGQVRGQL